MKKYFSVFMTFCLIFLAVTGCSNKEKDIGIDVDLTGLSSIMVYAKVYDIMTNPDDYMGKTIKLNGLYAVSDFQGGYYHFVLVEGADSCCPEGLEFRWSGNHVYPDDYPSLNTRIEFVGVFGSHEDFGYTYYYLAVDEIIVLE